MIDIEIRPCKREDFDGVLVLLGQLWPGKALDTGPLQKVYESALACDQKLYLCAGRGKKVVGFGSLAIKSNLWSASSVGYVDELVVEEAHRGTGVGRELLERLTAWARERGCVRVELDCAFHRKEAHAFYEKLGFRSRAYLYSKIL